MKCNKCGKEINEQAKFCKYCGTPVQAEKQVSSANTQNGVSRKNSKTWLIIASILFGILVLTGVTAFAIKMTGEKDKATQKAEKPKQEDPVKPEESTEEPKEEPKTETPEQAFENYLVFLVDAVNSGDYTGAEKVMVKDSPLYQDQKKLVEKLYADGTKEKLTKQGIKSQEDIDDTHVRLISDEEYEITYADGTVKTVSQSFAYVCELTEQGWLLTTLEAENSGGTSSSNKDAYIQAYQEYISANQEYLNKFREDYDGSVSQASYAIVDIQNDGIPEVILCVMNSYGGVSDFLYMGKDGTIKNYQDFYAWISYEQDTGLIFSSTGGGHMGISEGIFQYDGNADTFQEIHGGGYLYGANADNECSDMKWDGVEYPTMEAYNAKIDEVFNRDTAENIEYKDYTFDVDLLQEISNF
jgi:predicted nucleic acid-binding Zn ribbon protein